MSWIQSAVPAGDPLAAWDSRARAAIMSEGISQEILPQLWLGLAQGARYDVMTMLGHDKTRHRPHVSFCLFMHGGIRLDVHESLAVLCATANGYMTFSELRIIHQKSNNNQLIRITACYTTAPGTRGLFYILHQFPIFVVNPSV